MTATVVLWLFILNLGTAFGAGVYEHRIVLSSWLRRSRTAGDHWDAEAARRDDTGRRFWGFVSTAPLTLLTLANLVAASRAPGAAAGWWLAAASIAAVERVMTFGYFIPAMVGLMKAADSPAAVARARRWQAFDHLRHVALLAAWLAALQTLAVLSRSRG